MQDVEKLTPHRSVGFKRNPLEFCREILDGTIRGQVHEVRLELQVLGRMNPHGDVPLAVGSQLVADGVARETQ